MSSSICILVYNYTYYVLHNSYSYILEVYSTTSTSTRSYISYNVLVLLDSILLVLVLAICT